MEINLICAWSDIIKKILQNKNHKYVFELPHKKIGKNSNFGHLVT